MICSFCLQNFLITNYFIINNKLEFYFEVSNCKDKISNFQSFRKGLLLKMMYVALLLVWTCLPVTLSILQTAQSTKSIQQAYLDAEPVDSNHFLALIKEIKISRFRWDLQSRNRERLGAIGPEIATLIPEAVEIVPKRILPPTVKGGEPIVLHDVPVVNDNMIFWMSVGAQQALIKRVESLSDSLSYQVDQVVRLFGETAKLDNLLSESSGVESELRMKASIAKAKIAQSDLEIDIQRAKEEKDYHDLQKQMEMMELKRNEELVALRLAQEVETSRSQAEEEMRIRFESNAKIDRARNDAAEAISLMQFERDISLQSISEKMKAESAKVRPFVLFGKIVLCRTVSIESLACRL